MAEETPPEPPPVPTRVTGHALDVLMKLIGEELVNLLPARFGITLAPIRRHLPNELPRLDLHLERVDRLYELEDLVILDLEYEAALSEKDLRRFIGYGLVLLDRYPGQSVHTVVICGPRTRSVPNPIDLHPIPYRLTCLMIGDQDGEQTLQRLTALVQAGQPWSATDRLDLILLPLMRSERDIEAVVREGLGLARALPATDQPRAVGALLALAYHYEGEDLLNRLVEELMGTNVLEDLFAEKMQQRFAEGLERGVEQGLERGVEQGLERGRAEEARLLLRRYLVQRFGAIPAALEERIANSDATTLTALFDQALTATSVDILT